MSGSGTRRSTRTTTKRLRRRSRTGRADLESSAAAGSARPRERGGAVPEGILRGSYEALARGDAGPLLGMLPAEFEWTEPELPGYPLSGVHRGSSGMAKGLLAPLAELLDGLTFELREVVVSGDREVVTGVMHGNPAGSPVEWELPFAHVWELSDGAPVRATGYFDRSRLILAGSRRQLARNRG